MSQHKEIYQNIKTYHLMDELTFSFLCSRSLTLPEGELLSEGWYMFLEITAVGRYVVSILTEEEYNIAGNKVDLVRVI